MEDAEKIKKLEERRRLNLGSLVSSSPILTAIKKETEKIASEPIIFTGYNLKIKAEHVDYLKRYAFTMSCKLGRKFTIAEAIDDAIETLIKRVDFELKPLPEWHNKKRKNGSKINY